MCELPLLHRVAFGKKFLLLDSQFRALLEGRQGKGYLHFTGSVFPKKNLTEC